jgi:transposase
MFNEENYDYCNIKHDCRLLYKNNEFSLLIPEDIKQKNNTSNKVISIDPGIKTFLTGITNVSVYQFGNNLCDTIKKDLIRIDYLNKNLNKRRKQLIKVASERIKNRIIDMHWKCINHIINKSKIGTIILNLNQRFKFKIILLYFRKLEYKKYLF